MAKQNRKTFLLLTNFDVQMMRSLNFFSFAILSYNIYLYANFQCSKITII
jgi:hypothetical protein